MNPTPFFNASLAIEDVQTHAIKNSIPLIDDSNIAMESFSLKH